MTSGSAQAAWLAGKITAAGIPLAQASLTPAPGGADNLVFTATTTGGAKLIIKTPRRPATARYGTAAWAAATLASHGIPAPKVLWHDSEACAETRCVGMPLTGTAGRPDTTGTTADPATLHAARQAGALLRKVHAITVAGYGRLTPAGTGPCQSLLDSMLQETPQAPPGRAGQLAGKAWRVVTEHREHLDDPGPRLLLGDCAARHIYLNPRTDAITGFIDLESARGGHPLADVAGFSVREHPQITRALLDGYFPADPAPADLWALTLHRARIAAHLLLFHSSRGEDEAAARLTAPLAADITAITRGTPTALPAQPR